MWRLAKRAEASATSVQKITMVTIVFLPISVMASVFSMTVFSNEKGRMTVSKPDLVWFFVATFVLFLLMWGGWWVSEVFQRKKSKREDEEENSFS